MKTNWSTRIVGSTIELVPYRRNFVTKYHVWMQDPYILDMTASEPMTLEEEFENQLSWKTDEHKCTFIILKLGDEKEDCRMVGDINLFLDRYEKFHAEINLMVAEESCRRKGYGREALFLMLQYGIRNLGIIKYTAKISQSNIASLGLFRSFGFEDVCFVEAFQEYELSLNVASSFSSSTLTSSSTMENVVGNNTTAIDTVKLYEYSEYSYEGKDEEVDDANET